MSIIALCTPRFKNAISNGNFSSGTTGWISSAHGTIAAENGKIKYTAVTQSSSARVETSSNPATVEGHKYYISSVINPSIQTPAKLLLTGVDMTAVTAPISTDTRVSAITTAGATASPFRIYVNSPSAVLTAGATVLIDDVIAFDLTARYGPGNEPSLTWCDAHIPKNIIW